MTSPVPVHLPNPREIIVRERASHVVEMLYQWVAGQQCCDILVVRVDVAVLEEGLENGFSTRLLSEGTPCGRPPKEALEL